MTISIRILLVVLITSLNFSIPQAQSENCLRTFEDFAYKGPLTMNDIQGIIPPNQTWSRVADIPSLNSGGFFVYPSIRLIRSYKGDTQIWLSSEIYTDETDAPFIHLIFSPASGDWQYIDATVFNTDYFVTDIFQTSDNEIWGFVDNATFGRYEVDVPLLSKYNDELARFEIIPFTITGEMPDSISTLYTPEPSVPE